MAHDLLSRGIYAVINKSHNLVYIGETERNFLIRWIEHLNRIQDHLIIPIEYHSKKMDDEKYIRDDFLNFEQEAYEFYRIKGWSIVSSHNYTPNGSFGGHETDKEKLLERYRKAINQMA